MRPRGDDFDEGTLGLAKVWVAAVSSGTAAFLSQSPTAFGEVRPQNRLKKGRNSPKVGDGWGVIR